MCRSRSERSGGKRCPCHSDPYKVKGSRIRQLMSRYARQADAAEAVGNEEALTHSLGLFQDQCDRLAEHEGAVRTRRPKPPTRAVEFTPESTAHLSDEELVNQLHSLDTDPEAIDAVLAVLEHRDQARDRARAEDEARRAAAAQRTWSAAADNDAWGVTAPTDPLNNPARRPARGLTKEQQTQEEYACALHAKFLAAEEATNGNMVNARGRALGIDPYTLFSGPSRRAIAYGSDELLSFFRDNGRLTYRSYRYARLGWESDSKAARAAQLEDFGHVA